MSTFARYWHVFLAFARNSLVRDMTFRGNFILDSFSSLSWMLMNLGFYLLVFEYTSEIGRGTGWGKYQFFAFLATSLFINSLVQAFFMPNCEEISEQIRTGRLDFALLKPIDTQFLVSLQKIEWSSLINFAFGGVLLVVSLMELAADPETAWRLTWWQCLLYPLYVACGVAILYSLMISLAATSIWLGRNQSLYDFWFYITNFSRYPREIYRGPVGDVLQYGFTWIVPVLVVVNVPAQIIAKPMTPAGWWLALFALLATAVCLGGSRWLFQRALASYRSASS